MKKTLLLLIASLFLLHSSAQPSAVKPATAETPLEFLKKMEAHVTLGQQEQAISTFKEFEKKFTKVEVPTELKKIVTEDSLQQPINASTDAKIVDVNLRKQKISVIFLPSYSSISKDFVRHLR